MTSGPLLATVLAWLLAVAWSDWTRLRIPNRLLAGAATFLLLAAVFGVHPAGLSPWLAAAGAALVLCLGFPLFALGVAGAGDVKLLAVLGALAGPTESLLLIVAGASLLAGLHVAGWHLLRLPLRGLPLSAAPAAAGARRRLPHGVHLAMAAAFVACTRILPS